jgi:uncharacterized protein YbjQ (UPF0145 family)
MKLAIGIVGVLLLSGCATALTSQGTDVRIVDDKAANNCKMVGTVSGFDTMSATTADQSENALNETRNKAGQTGANGIKIIHMQTTLQGTSVTAEALRCQYPD